MGCQSNTYMSYIKHKQAISSTRYFRRFLQISKYSDMLNNTFILEKLCCGDTVLVISTRFKGLNGYFDYQTGYPDLLQIANVPGIKIMVLRYLAIEVFKCVNEISPAYLNDMFTRKQCPYTLRDSSILVRPKVNLTQYGLQSFKSYGA